MFGLWLWLPLAMADPQIYI